MRKGESYINANMLLVLKQLINNPFVTRRELLKCMLQKDTGSLNRCIRKFRAWGLDVRHKEIHSSPWKHRHYNHEKIYWLGKGG